MLVWLGAACARGNAIPNSARTTPTNSTESVAVARAVGVRLREEYRSGFVIYPVFLRSDASPVPVTKSPEMDAVLDGLRIGARSQFADTTAIANPTTRIALPDSARYFFTLMAPPMVEKDSAYADVYSSHARIEDGPIEQTVFRYTFVRAASTWRFVRRALRYAS